MAPRVPLIDRCTVVTAEQVAGQVLRPLAGPIGAYPAVAAGGPRADPDGCPGGRRADPVVAPCRPSVPQHRDTDTLDAARPKTVPKPIRARAFRRDIASALV